MVGHWPRQELPQLERELLGEVVRRCWTDGCESSQRLRADVIEFVRAEGLQVYGDDDLQFDASPLFPEIAVR